LSGAETIEAPNGNNLHQIKIHTYGQASSSAGMVRKPKAQMLIKMLRRDDPADAHAVDVRTVLKAKS
jgi:hypothetical protein